MESNFRHKIRELRSGTLAHKRLPSCAVLFR